MHVGKTLIHINTSIEKRTADTYLDSDVHEDKTDLYVMIKTKSIFKMGKGCLETEQHGRYLTNTNRLDSSPRHDTDK